MSKYILIFITAFALMGAISHGQNGFDNYLQKDSVYRFNSSLRVLDSLLTIQTKQSIRDTAFYNSYGKAGVFTLNQLLFAAVNNNPDLIAIQTKIDVSNFQAEGMTYLPDPMFEFELDDIMSDFSKVGMINFYISQMFPFPGKLALEKKSVMNNKAMMQTERLAMAVDIMSMIKMNYYDLYLINNKIQVNHDNQLLLKTFTSAAEAQYMVGKGMQQEVFKAQIETSRLQNEDFILKQQRKNIFSELTKLTKVVVDEDTKINFGDIDTEFLMNMNNFNINSIKTDKLIDYAFEHRPDLKTLKNKITMNQTDLEMAKINRLPDFNIKLGYKILPFEEKNAFYQKLFTYIPELPEEAKEFYFSCPGLAASTVLLENIGLYIENFSGIPYTHEENVTLMRFGNVFQQTYTRFLDLQKAEAQTRESQIETALERVRSRTLAMHNSDELAETAAVVFRQLISLGIAPNRLYIAIIHDDNDQMEFWITDEDGTKVSNRFTGSKDKNVSIGKMYDGWTSKQKSITLKMEGKELEDYFHYLSDELHVPFKHGLSQKRRVQNIAYFSKGFIGIASPDDQSEETTRLLERFAAVFNLTYARFNDLKHAEMQTHKAKIEVALERVRARALAMQEPEELVEVAQVMRYEMGLLGVEELETSSIYIHDEGSDIANCWYAIKNIRAPEEKLVADHITMELHQTWVGREMLDFYNSNQQQISIVMKGANRIEWIKYCSGISDVLGDFYGDVIPDRTYHLYKFSNGAIGAASEGDISEESWELLRRATSVFSLAYSRFKDLTQARMDLEKLKTEKQRAEEALAHLKAAQTQLIQSEKMASLGELTAGIAHEIQNPLNFVNNFSDVNSELIEEMKEELASGNMQEAIAIANDIADNEQKINHHGKRADAIVKGMLQHSRSSSGVKEPTDINALAEEYLRLAYHGLRAKDKSFNATMKTDFDPSIGLINIIQQDIGRVILNLITNAFYVVSAKAADLKTPIKEKPATADAVSAPKSPDTSAPWHPIGAKNYTPAVSVRTRLLKSPSADLGASRVEISVSDNGSGIPQNILDKIFQPFFTTKPTGQGTGLGLSLSYDIVKAHGGELKVQTTEGEGTTFSIQLPIGNP